MASYDYGKKEVCDYIRAHFDRGSTCLDVGACDGKWNGLLGDYLTMDAVEIWQPYIEYYHLYDKYRKVYEGDIADQVYDWYDLIIFGDVIEHMDPDAALSVLEYARPRCQDMIIGVPFCYYQDAINGNPYEFHVQNDLTHELFNERYKNFEILLDTHKGYCYYHVPQAAER